MYFLLTSSMSLLGMSDGEVLLNLMTFDNCLRVRIFLKLIYSDFYEGVAIIK